MNRTAKWVGIGLAALLVLNLAAGAAIRPRDGGQRVALSATLDAIDSGQVTRATLFTRRVRVVLRDGRRLSSSFPDTYGDDLIVLLHQRRAQIEFRPTAQWSLLLVLVAPFVLFGLFWIWLARRLPRPAQPDRVPDQI